MIHVYDDLARFYDRAFAPLERWFLAKWRREAIALLPQSGRILEIGCGTGANFQFYEPGWSAVSTDVSSEMLAIASGRRSGNHLASADAMSLPFEDGQFDAAFCTLVFCSVPDQAVAFAEVWRVLKPGGRLVMLEHVRPPGGLGHLFDSLSKLTVALIDDHFDRETAAQAAKSGLTVREVRSKARGSVNLIVCEKPTEAGSMREQVDN
jgi:phosphatidylethanolamine/phosphatidyl-N-methylethanolamine N-methyltransferase